MATRFGGKTTMDGWWRHLNPPWVREEETVIYGAQTKGFEGLFMEVNCDVLDPPLQTEAFSLQIVKESSGRPGKLTKRWVPKRKALHT